MALYCIDVLLYLQRRNPSVDAQSATEYIYESPDEDAMSYHSPVRSSLSFILINIEHLAGV